MFSEHKPCLTRSLLEDSKMFLVRFNLGRYQGIDEVFNKIHSSISYLYVLEGVVFEPLLFERRVSVFQSEPFRIFQR